MDNPFQRLSTLSGKSFCLISNLNFPCFSLNPSPLALSLQSLMKVPPHTCSLPAPPALLPYVPHVPTTALPGKLTATTFALERPCCIFDHQANASDAVWLVVAFANASDTFRNPPSRADPGSPGRAYQLFPDSTSAYMTLNTTLLNYPCPKTDGEITVLRVGSETSCQRDNTRPTCNGPLPGPGPYRVKFVAWNDSGPVAETSWSDAAMIALTSILTILFATLLAVSPLCPTRSHDGYWHVTG
uniref:Uroplakin 3B n=1 Tax=Strigops habroptila TaxID=2489341 RepID=A0A672UHP4_STRHB